MVVIGVPPVSVFAEESGCTHVHDALCGFAEGVPCGYVHEHNETCGYDPETGEGCTDVHIHDTACGFVEAALCTHEHDENCGGIPPASSGTPTDAECVCESLCAEDAVNEDWATVTLKC
jgi:hypothetical protein